MDGRARDRLRWRARRGLLENDLLLTRYLDRHLAVMGEEEMRLLDRLLLLDDNNLLDLLMGRTVSDDPGLAGLIANIRDGIGSPDHQ
ncbi:MAG: succinate dehydrogenase assembly factor 2 [Burkholderiales bacterium]|nr:succinate dehydrogenase assembly factor 2 [Burkholderiales bacterium]